MNTKTNTVSRERERILAELQRVWQHEWDLCLDAPATGIIKEIMQIVRGEVPERLSYCVGTEVRPLHKHDCDQCHFLGHFDDRQRDEIVDLYYCDRYKEGHGRRHMLIVRYGDEGEYASYPLSCVPTEDKAMMEVLRRARKRGLLKECL